MAPAVLETSFKRAKGCPLLDRLAVLEQSLAELQGRVETLTHQAALCASGKNVAAIAAEARAIRNERRRT